MSLESDDPPPNGNPLDIERRLIVARALASEHGMPLGFHDEEDQLSWDRKACAVLRELDAVDDSCEYGQADCEGRRGGVCVCGAPDSMRAAYYDASREDRR